jgi:hypothetical protein
MKRLIPVLRADPTEPAHARQAAAVWHSRETLRPIGSYLPSVAKPIFTEKTILQTIVGFAAVTPVVTGLAGLINGPTFLGMRAWPVDLDSHFRFYSGIFLGIGIAWYSCIPNIEKRGARFQLLAVLTFAGGLGRLLSLIMVGAPSVGHLLGLGMELAGVPLLVLWQARIARTLA